MIAIGNHALKDEKQKDVIAFCNCTLSHNEMMVPLFQITLMAVTTNEWFA